MMPSDIDDLTRTRTAFDTWRATQPGRRRIPEQLWEAALALLDHYSPARVCRELRLSPTQLRHRLKRMARPPAPGALAASNFIQVRAADLGIAPSTFENKAGSRLQSAEASLRLIFERSDGSRLTLCLPASEWAHLEALCTAFMR